MRFRLYRYMEGLGVSTGVKVPGILAAIIYLGLCALGWLAVAALIYAMVA